MKEKMMNRKTQITIERHSITIIRTNGGRAANTVYCEKCRANAAGFRGAHAALIFQTNAEELERLSLLNQIHRAGSGDLCGNSLAAFFGREIRFIED